MPPTSARGALTAGSCNAGKIQPVPATVVISCAGAVAEKTTNAVTNPLSSRMHDLPCFWSLADLYIQGTRFITHDTPGPFVARMMAHDGLQRGRARTGYYPALAPVGGVAARNCGIDFRVPPQAAPAAEPHSIPKQVCGAEF